MESRLADATMYFEQGRLSLTIVDAEAALDLARRLRDYDATYEIEDFIWLTERINNGNWYFDDGSYQRALYEYLEAADIAAYIPGLNTAFLEERISTTKLHISFLELMEKAQGLAEASDFAAALSIYEQAQSVASSLSFAGGINQAEAGMAHVQELIIAAKRDEARDLISRGDRFFHNGRYVVSIAYFRIALGIYAEIGDQEGINATNLRIDLAERKLAEAELQDSLATDDAQDDSQDDSQDDAPNDAQNDADGQAETLSNYEHNLAIRFDLRTLIDNQNQRPASRVRMGATEGSNEGWYNGCGWIASYNALILLGNPRHPADIVRHFETNGGMVLGGMFGTYPRAIERLFRALGYDVSHVLFPQLSTDLDNAIKSSGVGILAYAHTRAAHYIAIEYRAEDGRFIVYNDGFARARSAYLGYESYSNTGAVIDSVSALIQNTSDILFSFSLITIS
jgi:hypothetical protein